MQLRVGNIPLNAPDGHLRKLFTDHGKIATAAVSIDGETDRSLGFGLVELADNALAREAVRRFNRSTWNSRTLVVSGRAWSTREKRWTRNPRANSRDVPGAPRKPRRARCRSTLPTRTTSDAQFLTRSATTDATGVDAMLDRAVLEPSMQSPNARRASLTGASGLRPSTPHGASGASTRRSK